MEMFIDLYSTKAMLTNHFTHYFVLKIPKPEHISRTLLPFSLLFRALLSDGLSNLPPALGQSSRVCRIILGDEAMDTRVFSPDASFKSRIYVLNNKNASNRNFSFVLLPCLICA